MSYYLLDDLPESQPLIPRPVQIWILLTMEIVIRYRSECFLLAIQPYYADAADSESLFEGAWAPPFVGVPVPQRYDVAGSPAVLRQRFSETESAIRPVELIEQFLYEMGVENPAIEERAPFIEVKSSPRNPNIVKAYKIRRFSVQSNLSTSKSNLADPDGRKGFVYLPIDRLQRYVVQHVDGDATPRWSFLGLPLMTNLATVLSQPSEINRLRASAVDVAADYFFHDQDGLLIVLDLGGYGRTVRYVTENMNSLEATGRELADFFRARLAQWFAEFLGAIGARQIQHAGDGFLCALTRVNTEVFQLLADELLKFQGLIDGINDRLPSEYRLGTRIALHGGAYRYGRVGGPLSAVPGFDGENVVTVARLEQALAAYTRQKDIRAGRSRHFAVTSLSEELERVIFADASWSPSEEGMVLQSKEFSTTRRVWSRSPSLPAS